MEVEELKRLTKEDLKEFFHKFLSTESRFRRKLAVYVYPSEMHEELINSSIKVFCNLY